MKKISIIFMFFVIFIGTWLCFSPEVYADPPKSQTREISKNSILKEGIDGWEDEKSYAEETCGGDNVYIKIRQNNDDTYAYENKYTSNDKEGASIASIDLTTENIKFSKNEEIDIYIYTEDGNIASNNKKILDYSCYSATLNCTVERYYDFDDDYWGVHSFATKTVLKDINIKGTYIVTIRLKVGKSESDTDADFQIRIKFEVVEGAKTGFIKGIVDEGWNYHKNAADKAIDAGNVSRYGDVYMIVRQDNREVCKSIGVTSGSVVQKVDFINGTTLNLPVANGGRVNSTIEKIQFANNKKIEVFIFIERPSVYEECPIAFNCTKQEGNDNFNIQQSFERVSDGVDDLVTLTEIQCLEAGNYKFNININNYFKVDLIFAVGESLAIDGPIIDIDSLDKTYDEDCEKDSLIVIVDGVGYKVKKEAKDVGTEAYVLVNKTNDNHKLTVPNNGAFEIYVYLEKSWLDEDHLGNPQISFAGKNLTTTKGDSAYIEDYKHEVRTSDRNAYRYWARIVLNKNIESEETITVKLAPRTGSSSDTAIKITIDIVMTARR